MGRAWDDPAELATLHRLWMIDGLSAGLIGRQLGCSRNSIIGKVHRMGWRRLTLPKAAIAYPKRECAPKPERAPRRSKQHPGPSFVTPNWQPEGPKAPTLVEIGDMTRTDGFRIMDDEFGGCKWPIGGTGAETRFCCLPSAGQTYCQAHEHRSVNATQPIPSQDSRLFKWLVRKAA